MGKSNSSISNFEYNSLETTRTHVKLWHYVVIVFLLFISESILWQNTNWFSDVAACYWKNKQINRYEKPTVSNSSIIFLGDSVTLHGVNSGTLNMASDGSRRYANLALNGANLHNQHSILNRYIRAGNKPKHLCLEFSKCWMDEKSITSGPSWRFWMSPEDFASAGIAWHSPGSLFEFTYSRLFASYCYSTSLDNFVSRAVSNCQINKETLLRNEQIQREMQHANGYAAGNFTLPLTEPLPSQNRPFLNNKSGFFWLQAITETCTANSIDLTLFTAPVPMQVESDRIHSGYYKSWESTIANLQIDTDKISLTIRHAGVYSDDLFSDDHHLNHRCAERFTSDIAQWNELIKL